MRPPTYEDALLDQLQSEDGRRFVLPVTATVPVQFSAAAQSNASGRQRRTDSRGRSASGISRLILTGEEASDIRPRGVEIQRIGSRRSLRPKKRRHSFLKRRTIVSPTITRKPVKPNTYLRVRDESKIRRTGLSRPKMAVGDSDSEEYVVLKRSSKDISDSDEDVFLKENKTRPNIKELRLNDDDIVILRRPKKVSSEVANSVLDEDGEIVLGRRRRITRSDKDDNEDSTVTASIPTERVKFKAERKAEASHQVNIPTEVTPSRSSVLTNYEDDDDGLAGIPIPSDRIARLLGKERKPKLVSDTDIDSESLQTGSDKPVPIEIRGTVKAPKTTLKKILRTSLRSSRKLSSKSFQNKSPRKQRVKRNNERPGNKTIQMTAKGVARHDKKRGYPYSRDPYEYVSTFPIKLRTRKDNSSNRHQPAYHGVDSLEIYDYEDNDLATSGRISFGRDSGSLDLNRNIRVVRSPKIERKVSFEPTSGTYVYVDGLDSESEEDSV